jgi:hypothetical protein
MLNHSRSTVIRSLIYRLGCALKATLSCLLYNRVSFLEHYHGPDYLAVIQDYDNELRAKIKSDEDGSYYDAREKLYEACEDRGVKIWEF